MFCIFVLCVAFVGYSINGQVISESSCNSLYTNECQDGDKALPAANYSSKITITDLKNLFIDREAIKLACRSENKVKYKAAAICIANSYRHCADNDFKTLIPTADKYGEAITYICDNAESADHILNCLSDSYTDCTLNKLVRGDYLVKSAFSGRYEKKEISRDSAFSEHKENYCRPREIEEECVRDDIDVQACLDSGNYEKYVEMRNILRPSACGASAIIFTTFVLVVSLVASIFH